MRGSGPFRVRRFTCLLAAVLVAPVLILASADEARSSTQTFTGEVSSSGTSSQDHSFEVLSNGTLTATLDWTVASADLNLGLRDPDGNWTWTRSRKSKPEVITLETSTSGVWTARVSAKSGSSSYTLAVEHSATTTTTTTTATTTTTTTTTTSTTTTTATTATSEGATIGDRAWSDTNGNGLQDTGESGLSGVSVDLYEGSVGDTPLLSTQSAGDGTFSFADIAPGTYRLGFRLPSGYSYSPALAGTDPQLDSEASPKTGRTSPFDVVAGSVDGSRDAGAVPTGATTFTAVVDSTGTSWRNHLLPVSEPGTLTIVLDWEDTGADLDLFLFDPAGNWVKSSTAGKPLTLTHAVATTGTWRIGVKAVSGRAAYVVDARLSDQAIVAPSHLKTIGGPGRAEMYPSGLDVDPQGIVYVADTGNDNVAAYDTAGQRLWTSGKRGRQAGQFAEPRDVAYHNGRLYVADTGNNRVQVLNAADGAYVATWATFFRAIMGVSAGLDGAANPVVLTTDAVEVSKVRLHSVADGTVLREVGTFGTGNGQLNEPRDAATDAAGNIFVADYRNHRVARFNADGTWLGSWGSLGSEPGNFNAPYGIDLDDAGDVYVADSNNARVQKLSGGDGSFLKSWGEKGEGPGQFLALRRAVVGGGPDPAMHAADLWGYKVVTFSASGATERVLGAVPPPLGGFNKPYGAAVRPTAAFVADTTNQRVQRFGLDGTFELEWGARGFGETIDGFNWLRDVTVNEASSTVWVADTKNNRIIQYSYDGVPSGQKYGTLGSQEGQFHWPHGIASYGEDLIVADTNNNRIVRVSPPKFALGDPVVWSATGFKQPKDVTVHGNMVYVADSLNARVVRLDVATGAFIDSFGGDVLHRPEGVAVEPNGDIWVTDTSWNRLIEFSPSGTYLQKFGSLGSTNGKFSEPTKLEILETPTGIELYVVDTSNDRVEVYDIG